MIYGNKNIFKPYYFKLIILACLCFLSIMFQIVAFVKCMVFLAQDVHRKNKASRKQKGNN